MAKRALEAPDSSCVAARRDFVGFAIPSAAEPILLEALRAPRVRFVGTPAGSVLDSGNASIVRLREGNTRWLFGYPTIVAIDRVRAEGIRGRGVRPDVLLSRTREEDAVGAALERVRGASGADLAFRSRPVPTRYCVVLIPA